MSPERKVFSSSLYPEVEVEIDGVVFKVQSVNRPIFDLTESMLHIPDKESVKAIGIVYDQIAMVLVPPEPAPGETAIDVKKFIDSRDFRMIRDVMRYVNEHVILAGIEGEQKKGSEPGATPSP